MIIGQMAAEERAAPEHAAHEPGGHEGVEPPELIELRDAALAIERAVAEAVVGQQEALRGTLICLIAGGHALLEGVPGLGKTTMVRAYAQALGLPHSRIQFTPDLMPADITGTTVLAEHAGGAMQMRFQPGPIFASVVLADEINRASPRTQSALLEAMQEATVTIAGTTHELPSPFCVLATQNPIELRGTYPLPEAQLDRFFLQLRFRYPSRAELTDVVRRTTGGPASAGGSAAPGSGGEGPSSADPTLLPRLGALARELPSSQPVLDYASRLVLALHPGEGAPGLVNGYVRLGPSPRGAQALVLAGRIAALLAGRHNLAFEDIRDVAPAALRHRLILGFDAERDGIDPDAIVAEAIERTAELS
jgi:MoxR-like ATPase